MQRSTSHDSVRALALALALVLALTGCGKKAAGPAKGKEDAAAGPLVAPLTAPTSGVDQIKRMNFVYEDGRPAYEKALAAYKAKPRDWEGIRTHTEAALAKDSMHLDAHHLLARALAHAGEHAAAVDHLVSALAGDYFRYGPGLAKDAELAEFLTTPHGQAVTALAARILEDYQKRIATSVWIVARRSSFKWPKNPGVQPVTSRGELYAYDRDTKRYLRLTHTDHKVAGFVRAGSGSEVAILGFDKIDHPAPAKGAAGAEPGRKPAADPPPAPGRDEPATFAGAWVQVLATTDWQAIGKKVALPAARELALGYGTGDQLLVATAQPTGRWTTGEPVVSTVDTSTGKATKTGAKLPEPRIVLTLDEGRLVRGATGIDAAWTGDRPTAPTLKIGSTVIQVPESGAASQAALAIAPDNARLAFATAVDPCSRDTAPSLYVADAKTGALKHLLTAKSRFVTRWIDATTLAYEDGEGAVRIWDATAGREALKLDNKPGIALDVLSIAPAPLCTQAPPTAEPATDVAADEPPLPPEEPGPITAPE